MSDNRAGTFLGGMLLGTAVGTALGLLIAPRSGRETRRFLRKSAQALPDVAEDLKTSVQYQSEKLLDSAKTSLDDTFDRLQDAIEVGKEAMNQTQRDLSRQKLPLAGEGFQAELVGSELDEPFAAEESSRSSSIAS